MFFSQSEMFLLRRSVLCLQSSSLSSTSSKPKIVVLGVGWGGFRVAKDLDKSKFDVTVVSPRNHFLFTPLLPSTTVGTLEFRCVQEPARTIQGIKFYQAKASGINLDKKTLQCTDVYRHKEDGPFDFELPYDKLVVAVGTKSNTFGIKGVESREEGTIANVTGTSRKSVFFLKQLEHARAIRNRILECFERASSSFLTAEERKRLLTFVVVGGGPTSVEFASELCDFLKHDVEKWFSDLKSDYKVVMVEAGGKLLGSFDKSLSEYVEKTLKSRHVDLRTNCIVKEVKDYSVEVLRDGSLDEIPFGVCVWSTGNAALSFVSNSGLPIGAKSQRIKIDSKLRVEGCRDVYAIGDCAEDKDRPLAMLAQVANQQGIYLADSFNTGDDSKDFEYRFLGAMASLGTFKAVADLNGPKLKGFVAFLAWRSAYWTMSVSITNKILIPMYWFKSYFFGRDISKF